jgi:hypothetical protein
MVSASSVGTLCIANLILLVLCSIAANVHAQVAGGSISGTVSDSSARVISKVQIKITNIATGVSREVTTNEDGVYSTPNLLPGTYEAKFSAPGFQPDTRSGIELTVGAAVVLDLTLRVGGLHESIVVQSEVLPCKSPLLTSVPS